MSQCVDSISSWMRSNHLQLHADKTEMMLPSSTRKLPQLPSCPLSVGGAVVSPVSTVRDLGVFIYSDLGAATHVRPTVSRCFAVLHQLCHLHRYVTDDCFRSLVVSLVHYRLDYSNFVGLPAYLQWQLQSVLNAAARLVCRLYVATTMSQTPLQFCTGCVYHNGWTSFKLVVMAFRVLHGLAPPYLNQLVRIFDLPGRH